MKYLIVKIFWDKNRDPRVKELAVKMFFLGQDTPIDQYSLPGSANFLVAMLKDNSSYHINITSIIDDNNFSDASMSFDIPDMNNPLPLSGLNWEVINIIDVNEKEILEKVKENQLEDELDDLDDYDLDSDDTDDLNEPIVESDR